MCRQNYSQMLGTDASDGFCQAMEKSCMQVCLGKKGWLLILAEKKFVEKYFNTDLKIAMGVTEYTEE